MHIFFSFFSTTFRHNIFKLHKTKNKEKIIKDASTGKTTSRGARTIFISISLLLKIHARKKRVEWNI